MIMNGVSDYGYFGIVESNAIKKNKKEYLRITRYILKSTLNVRKFIK